jgi:photosystem II stability/assembly factor-like uncharacterized protein
MSPLSMPRVLRRPAALLALTTSLLAPATLHAATTDAGPKSEAAAPAAAKAPGRYDGLEYRPIGPAAGGRTARVTGVPGDPLTYWAATAAGGVWKSVNGGKTWSPMMDDQPVSSMGSIAVSPADPNLVWVGSGEANIRGNSAEGNGIYRSTDGGKSWTHVWTAEAQIGTMIAHPKDPDVAFAAVLGSPYGPGPDRGVYRTRDGGATWKKVLFVDESSGASDVCFHPTNPRILFAGTWQARRTPWDLTSGGPGSGLWTSRDGGDTWKRVEGAGLPSGIWGKVGVRFAPSQPSRVYALIEAEEGGLFRSDDGGESWKRVSASRGIRQRSWYYTTFTVDPQKADVLWFPQVGMLRSIDGGKTIVPADGGGWDHHDVWIAPEDTRRMIVASDAGVSLSRDGGATWTRAPMPIGQFYHLTVDNRTPYRVLGTLQDFGTASGPSRTLHGGGILLSDWHTVGGGEAGHVAVDSEDPDTVWAGEYMGIITKWDGRTRRAPQVGAYIENGSGHGAGDLEYRFQWTAPIVVSPHDPKVIYHAANVLFRTADGGQSWTAISPDLTRDDPEKQGWAGGPITGDNTGVETYDTIFAVAESPVTAGVIWAGSDDGLVHVTRNGGESWTKVTPPDLPEWATVTCIEASRWDEATAYLTADRHRLDDEAPYLWKTSDFGATWKRLDRGLDREIYLHVVREDSAVRGLLYLGTERGLQISRDDGKTWASFKLNLPTVAVVDLAVTANDLVVGTLGRSAWILDDLTAVRAGTTAASVALFPPPEATAYAMPSWWEGPFGSAEGAGKNPPRGAMITYRLAEKLTTPLTLDVLDGAGHVVRTLSSELQPQYTPVDHPDADPGADPKPDLSLDAGIHRVAWDLDYEQARWVAGTRIDTGGPIGGPKALPGDYEIRLTSGDVSVTQPLHVVADPRTETPADGARAQFELLLDVRDRANQIVDLVNALRSVREQIESRNAHLAAEGSDDAVAEIVAAGQAIVERLWTIERALHNPDAEVAYDVLGGRHGGAKLYPRYGWLADGAYPHPGPPTQGQREAKERLDAELEAQEAAFQVLVAGDLAALNDMAAAAGLGHVLVP